MKNSPFNPLVSIIITVHNHCDHLKEAIDSGLKQSYANIEILVINDGAASRDEAEKIAMAYGNKIRYYHKEKGSLGSMLNYGLQKMHGEYFSWLNEDSLYEPEKIASQVNFVTGAYITDLLVFSAYKTINPQGETIKEYRLPSNNPQDIGCLLGLEYEAFLNCETMLIPARLLKECGGFSEKLTYMACYELCNRLYELCEFAYLDQVLVIARVQTEDNSVCKEKIHESDDFRASVIKNLSMTEIEKYIGNNPERLISLFQKFLKNGYQTVSVFLLILLYKYYYKLGRPKEALGALDIIIQDHVKIENLLQDENPHKARLVFYYPLWIIGGTERVISSLFTTLSKKYEIVFITNQLNEEEPCFPMCSDVKHIQLNANDTELIPIYVSAITYLLQANLFIGLANFSQYFLPIYRILKIISIPAIMYMHNYYFFANRVSGARAAEIMRSEAYTHATMVVWVNLQDAAICSLDCPHSIAISNPVSLPSFQKRSYPDKKIILAVGRFNDTQKRVDLIFKLFQRIYRRDKNCKLLLVGQFPNLTDKIGSPVNKNLQEILDETNLPESSYAFVGPQNDVSKYYEQAALLIMASEYEGFPMVLVEAGAHGLPALVYGTPLMDTIIAHGENGYITSINEMDKAEELALMILNEQNEWERLSLRAMELAKRFTLTSFIKKWELLIELILNNKDLNTVQDPEWQEMIPRLSERALMRQILFEYNHYRIEEYASLQNSNLLKKYKNTLHIPRYRLRNINVLRNKSIILYGAGKVGIDAYHQLAPYQDINIKYWLDKNASSLSFDYAIIYHPEEISIGSEDYIVVAVLKKKLYQSIEKYLLDRGISKEKILWEEPEFIL